MWQGTCPVILTVEKETVSQWGCGKYKVIREFSLFLFYLSEWKREKSSHGGEKPEQLKRLSTVRS